ncbi:YihY/virulence factor BrkB family protein [Haloarchaeobius sp. DFWS5]|uniref:YihY/virulence factor BrkB family protein n=1 Tax=Haloarchaeobius sp. DFWS5 TaxID=3446114 RepID=UPI003EBF2E0C
MTALGGRVRDVCRGIYREVRAENVTFMAGSIAYHAFVSLIPFLLVVASAFRLAGEPALGQAVVSTVGGYVSPTNAEVLTKAVTAATDDTSITVVGSVTLLWGMLKIFRGLDTAFSDIYHVEESGGVVGHVVDGIIVLVAVVLAVVVAAAAGTSFAVDSATPYDPVVDYLALFGGVSLALFPMYYVFPDAPVTVREVLPGTVFAAVGLTAVETTFKYYVDIAASQTYGVIGTVLLLVTWLYVTGVIILLGATINAVLAGRTETADEISWTSDPPPQDWERLVADLDELDELRGTATRIVVETERGTVQLPPPTETTVHTRHVARPGPLGGEERDASVNLRWEYGDPDDDPEDGTPGEGDETSDRQAVRDPTENSRKPSRDD